jgi:hypothetical protein
MDFKKAISIKNSIASFLFNKLKFGSRIISFGGTTRASALNVTSDIQANVNGVGVGEKQDGENFIRVLTRNKSLVQPATFARHFGVKAQDIRIEETGPIRFKMPRNNHRPPFPGISVAHYKVSAGTLGCFVRDDKKKIYILSNNHVLANSNKGFFNDPILQPGSNDGGRRKRDMIATLSYLVEFKHSSPNLMDAALAQVVDGLSPEFLVMQKHKIVGTTIPENHMKVEKFGRTTGHTKGTITTRNLDLQVDFDGQLIDFENQFEVKASRGVFCDAGDSGSLILERDTLNAVGLLFAGTDDGTTFATPIKEILATLSVKIL